MRVVEELPVPFLPFTGLSPYLPNQPSTKEKFPLERVFLFSHSAGAHGTRGIAYCCNPWEGLQSPIIVSRLFITDTRKLLEWEGLGPSTAKRRCLAWQWEDKSMPQGCPNLWYWHYSLGRARCLELAERHRSSILLSPNDSSICHEEQLMDIERK